MQIALTDIAVRTLKPGRYFDEKLPAFGIRIGKHRRTWIAMKGENRNTITLGHYPAISLQDARRKAMAAFVAPEVAKAAITFPEARSAFLALDRWRPVTLKVLTSNLSKFTWKGQLSKIMQEQVIEALDRIESKSARWHARKDLVTFFNWCVPRYLSSSPMRGIPSESQKSRDRVLTDDELKAVWTAAGTIEGPYGAIIKLLLLTGQRRTEIGSLQCSWMTDQSIRLPGSVTKNGREHCIPLGTYGTSILNTPLRLALESERTLLFPARGKTDASFSGWSKSHETLLKLNSTAGWTPHDARRTFASNQARLGTPIHVIEKMLNHVSGSLSGVAGTYNRYSYWEEQRLAMQQHEDWILSLLPADGGVHNQHPDAPRRYPDEGHEAVGYAQRVPRNGT